MKRTKESGYVVSKDQALEIFSAESFLPINKKLLFNFGPELAVFISALVDQYRFIKKKQQLIQGDYFYFTTEMLTKHTGMTIYAIRKAKEFLLTNGIITIKKIGMPAKECFKLHLQTLMDISVYCGDYFDTSSGAYFVTSSGDEIVTTEKFINNKFLITRNKNLNKTREKTSKKVGDEFVPLARFLSKIIRQTKNIEHSSTQIKSWANEFRILCEQNKVEIKRMKIALKWYKIHVGGQYIPVIESGASFREKFTKLENAMQREKQNQERKSNSLGYRSLPNDHQFRNDGSI